MVRVPGILNDNREEGNQVIVSVEPRRSSALDDPQTRRPQFFMLNIHPKNSQINIRLDLAPIKPEYFLSVDFIQIEEIIFNVLGKQS